MELPTRGFKTQGVYTRAAFDEDGGRHEVRGWVQGNALLPLRLFSF